MSRRTAVVVLAVYLAGLAALTLGPPPGVGLIRAVRQIDGLEMLSFAAVEAIANVLLFVPLGFVLCALLPRLSRWALWVLCVLASISVELAQSLLPERETTPRDVVVNALGAALGVLLHAVLFRRGRSAEKVGRTAS